MTGGLRGFRCPPRKRHEIMAEKIKGVK